MTILEAIKTNTLLSEFSDDKILLTAVLRGYNLNAVVDTTSTQVIELLTADLYKDVLVLPEFSEGSLSIKNNHVELREYIATVAEKWNDKTLLTFVKETSSINDATELW